MAGTTKGDHTHSSLFEIREQVYSGCMAHPYRTRGSLPPEDPDPHDRMGLPTLAFGIVCALCGLVLAGSSRPYMALALGVAGPLVIASRRA